MLVALAGGCEDAPTHDNQAELITTVQLEFLPQGGGAPVVASWRDTDGMGGVSGTVDPVVLTQGVTYALNVAFLDESWEPAEDITEEIREESEEHLVLVYGPAVLGPASSSATAILEHSYADAESDYVVNAEGEDLPVGLRNVVVATAAGSGELMIMLRHLPALNEQPLKQATIPALLAAGDPNVPGDIDADVSFPVTVNPAS